MTPITRIEQLINAIVESEASPFSAVTRIESYLTDILNNTTSTLVPVTRVEMYLAKISGADVAIPAPVTRIEMYLAAIAGEDIEPPIPVTRLEYFLAEWAAAGGASLETVTGNAPVTLLNAVAIAIVSLTQTGLCTQASTPAGSFVPIKCNNGELKMVDDELPDGYKRVLGFTCNHNAMWQITDFKLRGSDTVKVSFSVTAACNVWGCYQSTSATDNYDLYATTTSGGKYFRYANGTYASYFSSENQGKRFDVVYTPTGSIGMPEDSTWTEATFESENDLLLGSTTVGGTSSKLKGNLYGDFIVENGGAERLHLVPCERLSDNVLGYYDLVGEVFYEPYEGFDGAVSLGYDGSHYRLQTVGSPATANLYDASTRVEGRQIAQDGTVSTNANFCYSAPIAVTANGKISLGAIRHGNGDKIRVAFYTDDASPSSANFISAVESSYGVDGTPAEITNITVPGTATHARLCTHKLNTDVMFNTGTSVLPYIPFIEGEAITVTGSSQNLVDESTNITGYYLNASGVANQSADAQYTDLIPVTAGRVYLWALTSNRVSGGSNRWHGYKSDGTWKQQITYKATGQGTGIPFELSAVIPDGVAYVRLSYGINDEDVELRQVMTQTATAENLYSVGDTKDTQEIISGLVDSKINFVILDGTEDGYGTSSAYGAAVYINSASTKWKANRTGGVLCTHFAQGTASGTQPENTCFFNASGHFYFRTDKTTAQFKTWLAEQYAAGTPVMVMFVRSTPTTESVTPQPLTTAEGTNTVSVTAEVSPIALEVEYYAKSA